MTHHRPSSKREKFVVILHRMLMDADSADQGPKFDQICSWMPHGRSFRIHQRDQFEKNILPLYFRGQKGLTSFQRQLNIYGFTLMTKNTLDEGAYFHPHFLRGRPDLLVTIHRKPVKKHCGGSGRSRPDLEPDFYKYSLEEESLQPGVNDLSSNSPPVLLPAPASIWPHEKNPNRHFLLEKQSNISLNAKPASHYPASDNARSQMTDQVLNLEAPQYYQSNHTDGSAGVSFDLVGDHCLGIKRESMGQVNMASLGASLIVGGNPTAGTEVGHLLHQEQSAHLPFSLVGLTSRDQLMAKQFASSLLGVHNDAFVEHQLFNIAGQYDPQGEAAHQLQQVAFLQDNSLLPTDLSPVSRSSHNTAIARDNNTLHTRATHTFLNSAEARHDADHKPSARHQASALIESYRGSSSLQDLSGRLRYGLLGESSVMLADVAAGAATGMIGRDINRVTGDNCKTNMPAAYRAPVPMESAETMPPGYLTATDMSTHTTTTSSQGIAALVPATSMLQRTDLPADCHQTAWRAFPTQSQLDLSLSQDSQQNHLLESLSSWDPSNITTRVSLEERLKGVSLSSTGPRSSPSVAQQPGQHDWLLYRSRSSSSGDDSSSVHDDDHHQYLKNADDNNNTNHYDFQPHPNPFTVAPAGDSSDQEEDDLFVSAGDDESEGVAYFENEDPRMTIEMFHFLQDVDL